MRKLNHLSENKKVKIVTNHILNKNEQGKYFPIKTKNPSQNIPLVRANMLPEFFGVFLQQVLKDRNWHDVILSGKKQRSIKDLDSVRLYPSDLESEYFWAKNIILINQSYLRDFIQSSSDYSKRLIEGDYKRCVEILDEIEKRYGYSIWLIKNKIAFLQLTQGLEAQKKYIQGIKNSLRDAGLIKFVLHWISIRNEPQTSIGRFTTQIDSIISTLNPEKQIGFQEFSRYHLLNVVPTSIDSIGHILRLSYSTSIVDYYESFVLLLQNFTNEASGKYYMRLKTLLFANPLLTIDKRLKLVYAISQRIVDIALISEGINSYNYFLQGKYLESHSLASEVLKRSPSNVLSILVKAYSTIMISEQELSLVNENKLYSPQTPLLDAIINGIREIFLLGIEGANEEYNQISKIALNFASSSWTASIEVAIGQEKYFLNKIVDKVKRTIHLDSFFNPILIDKIADQHLSNKYSDLCSVAYNSDNLALIYHLKLMANEDLDFPNTISEIHTKLALAEINFEKQFFDLAIKNAEFLKTSDNWYFARRGFGIQAFSYLNQDNLVMACKTVADCYIENKAYYPFLPLTELSVLIKPGSKNWKMVNSTIDLSIIFDAFVKHVDKSFETARRFAYEDYLEKKGIERPSELVKFLGEENKAKIIYYMQFICIESTMDMSGAFEGGSSEVLAERLQVCRILVDIDPYNEELHKSEINDLVRRQVILNRRQEVDQSRIYVDIESVKELALSELSEVYARYQAYLKFGVNSLSGGEKSFDKLAIESNAKASSTLINVPNDEVIALLSYMIGSISRYYLSSEVGLDRFISTRIRHGELERNMRKPLQNHNLITKKKIKTGPYLSNIFWIERFSDHQNIVINELDKAFLKFSENYDQLIATIANDWLQIVKVNKPNGLFDFTIHENDYQWIYDSTEQHTSFKAFVNNVISLLETKLIFTLVSIREKLNTVARIQAKNLLNTLQESTLSINNSPELQTAISQARTDLQSQFDKIIEWFVPSSTGNSAPYQIEDAIWVAEASLKEENPLFQIDVEAEEFEFSIHGQLPIFVDIFINIFENTLKRSGLDCPLAKVKIWTANESDDIIIILCEVTNALGKDVNQKNLDMELKRKKGILDSGDYVEYLATEKNSGLYKIYTSVKDFHIAASPILPTIDFGLKNDQFFVLISVPFKIFKLEEVEEI